MKKWKMLTMTRQFLAGVDAADDGDWGAFDDDDDWDGGCRRRHRYDMNRLECQRRLVP